MAPELDQGFGRLAAARLRPGVAPGLDGTARAAACPDAETWAAYADGGLAPDEVARLDEHLATCLACRRLLTALVGDAGAAIAPAAVPAADERRGVVLPFRPRLTWAWMSMAAALLAAVTVWSVTRLNRPAGPESATANRGAAPAQRESAPLAPPPSAPPTPTATAPLTAAEPTRVAPRQNEATPPAGGAVNRLARVGANSRGPAAANRPAAAAGGASASAPREERAASSEGKQTPARQIALQTNVAPPTARPHGPLANQQATQSQTNAPVSAPPAVAPATSAAPPPSAAKPAEAPASPAPAPARTRDDPQRAAGRERAGQAAQADAATADAAKDAEARRAAAPPALAETVTTTGAAAASGTRKAATESDSGRSAGFAALRAAAPAFAEPEGRLRWRIAGERRLESSSDGGTTWNGRYTSVGERLRAGSAPSIDAAWAVGERGLVLRLTVPGGWTPVPSRPDAATLVAVAATSADVARVTTEDGRVFVTTDGGQSWAPVPAGQP